MGKGGGWGEASSRLTGVGRPVRCRTLGGTLGGRFPQLQEKRHQFRLQERHVEKSDWTDLVGSDEALTSEGKGDAWAMCQKADGVVRPNKVQSGRISGCGWGSGFT